MWRYRETPRTATPSQSVCNTYFYRIRDRYPDRLVSALAIFTGENGNRMPGKYSYEYRGTKLTYEYPTVSILKPETNRKFDNLFKETDKTSVMNTVEYLKMEGKEEAATAFVENLLKGSDFVVEKIASLANVSVEFVNKVKNQLNGSR